MPRVIVQAFAKVNLGLRVLYRRPDNYHELRTIFQTVSLADTLSIEFRRGGPTSVELTCNLPELAGGDNLAARAAVAFLKASNTGGRVWLHLEKRVPAGAGLGGGSSDAAAVLRALSLMVRPRPDWALVHRLAACLGSDVPFFLLGGRALGLGRGTEIYPLADDPSLWLLIIAPATAVSTAEAYRRLSADLTSSRWEDKLDGFCSSVCAPELEPVTARPGELVNDFEPAVFRMHPELEELKARLKELGARPALLCGSGSALFGIFAGRRQALRARDSLALEESRSFVVSTVTRRAYRARWRKWLSNPAR